MWRTSCEDSAIQDANRRAGYELEIQPNAQLMFIGRTDGPFHEQLREEASRLGVDEPREYGRTPLSQYQQEERALASPGLTSMCPEGVFVPLIRQIAAALSHVVPKLASP